MNVALCTLPDGTMGVEMTIHPSEAPVQLFMSDFPANYEMFQNHIHPLTVSFMTRARPKPHTLHPPDWEGQLKKASAYLYPHQKKSVERAILEYDGRVLVALEQGLGKTPVACTLAVHYGGLCIFILPANKIVDFQREFQTVTGETLHAIQRGKDKIPPNASYIAISYDLARSHTEVLQTKWTTVVMDECHAIKNESQRAKKILPLMVEARAVILLSGTPQESRPVELYHILYALHPTYFPSREEFTKRYCRGHINAYGKWQEDGAIHTEELRWIMQEVMIRYTKDEVDLGLPKKIRELHQFAMTNPANIASFKRVREKKDALVKEEAAATDPREKERIHLDVFAQCTLLWTMTEAVKIQLCHAWWMQEMAAHPEDKWLVFVAHLNVLEQVETRLAESKVSHMVIQGNVTRTRREVLKTAFQTDPTIRVALMTLGAGSTGINMTAANRVLFLGITQRQMQQAEDRAHRMGQKKDVTCYWIHAGALTHDVSLFPTVVSRSSLASKILDGDTSGVVEFDHTIDHRKEPHEMEKELVLTKEASKKRERKQSAGTKPAKAMKRE